MGVNGGELAILSCLAIVSAAVLLVLFDHHLKKRALLVAHAGRFWAPDPYARSFHLHRPSDFERRHDPMTVGPACDATNPRFRSTISSTETPAPAFPTREESRRAAVASGGLDVFGVGSHAVATSAPMAAAGWYEDPDVPCGLRYWDGTSWTARRPA